MKISRQTAAWAATTMAVVTAGPAWAAPGAGALDSFLEEIVVETTGQFNGLRPEQLAITLVELAGPASPRQGSWRGTEQVYPASVVKLFYLAAAHRWLEDRRLEETPELRRAMEDMIRRSYNEATHYVVDLLTGTTSGPELSAEALEAWYDRRNVVNRYFASLGYEKINANRKPWCEGPYGREMQSIKAHPPNHRNWLTTEATARLLAEMATGQAVTADRSGQMLELLRRDPFAEGPRTDAQARDFIGAALEPGMKLWSKAGWTSETRHDAALVEWGDGRRIVLVVFTTGHAHNKEIIPSVARRVFKKWNAD